MLHIINTTCGLCISGDICIFEGIYYWQLPEQSLLLDIDEYTGYLQEREREREVLHLFKYLYFKKSRLLSTLIYYFRLNLILSSPMNQFSLKHHVLV